MITSRMDETSKLRIPNEVLEALGLSSGDNVTFHIVGGSVFLTREGEKPTMTTSPFGLFTEWADEADCRAFDNL